MAAAAAAAAVAAVEEEENKVNRFRGAGKIRKHFANAKK